MQFSGAESLTPGLKCYAMHGRIIGLCNSIKVFFVISHYLCENLMNGTIAFLIMSGIGLKKKKKKKKKKNTQQSYFTKF